MLLPLLSLFNPAQMISSALIVRHSLYFNYTITRLRLGLRHLDIAPLGAGTKFKILIYLMDRWYSWIGTCHVLHSIGINSQWE